MRRRHKTRQDWHGTVVIPHLHGDVETGLGFLWTTIKRKRWPINDSTRRRTACSSQSNHTQHETIRFAFPDRTQDEWTANAVNHTSVNQYATGQLDVHSPSTGEPRVSAEAQFAGRIRTYDVACACQSSLMVW